MSDRELVISLAVVATAFALVAIAFIGRHEIRLYRRVRGRRRETT